MWLHLVRRVEIGRKLERSRENIMRIVLKHKKINENDCRNSLKKRKGRCHTYQNTETRLITT